MKKNMSAKYGVFIIGFSILSALSALLLIQSESVTSEEGDLAHNLSQRELWEWMRYHDPATGKIPHNVRKSELEYALELPHHRFDKSEQALSSQWKSIGPWNVGGRTRAVAYDIRNENIIMAAGVSGGMWRSTDAGLTWKKTFSPRQLQSVTSLVQDTREGHEEIWYASSGEIWGNSAEISGDGILKSTDNGLTWNYLQETTSGTPGSWDKGFDYIWRIVTDHSNINQDVVMAAYALGGISRSTDGGTSWTNVLGGFGNNSSLFSEIAISKDGIFYASLSSYGTNQNSNSVHGGIYRSTDGIRWTNITPATFPKKYGRIAIGISPSDENLVYFLAHTPGTGKRYVSRRGDEDWNSLFTYRYIAGDGSGVQGKWDNLTENVPDLGGAFGTYNAQGSYNMYIKVHPDNSDIVFIGGTNIYRSMDGCKSNNYTWCGGYEPNSTLPEYGVYPNHHPDCHELIFLKSNPNKALSSTDGGVEYTENIVADKVQWISRNNGYLTTQFYTLAVDENPQNNRIMGGLQDNGTLFTSSNQPQNPWAAPGLGDGSYCDFGKNNRVYMSRQLGRMEHYELDNNGNVLKKGRFDPIGGKGYLFINPYILDPNDKATCYLAGGKILWRNNNLLEIGFGQKDSVSTNWDSLPATRIEGNAQHAISALAMGKNSSVLYYGTSQGKLYRLDDATKGQPVPKELKGNFPTAYISSIVVDNDNADHVVLCFSNYGVQSIFATFDGGNTWSSVGGNLDRHPKGTANAPAVKCVEIIQYRGKKVYYVGTSVGVFSTMFLNGNKTVWVQEGDSDIGNVPADMIKVRQADTMVFVATHGAGVYSSKVNHIPILSEKVELESPNNDAKGFYSTANLQWKSSLHAKYYELQISTKSDFSELVFSSEALSETTLNFNSVESGLMTYYWRVRGLNEYGVGEWSETRTFVSVVGTTVLTAPEANAQDIQRNPLFQWQNVNGATKYHLQVSSSFSFSTIDFQDSSIVDNQYRSWLLDADKQYLWRVRAGNADGWGDFSSRLRFKTGITVPVAEPSAHNVNVYPIPLRSILYIDIPDYHNENVKIEIYDVRGVAVLRKQLHKVSKLYSLDVSDIPKGVYILSISGKGSDIIYSQQIIKQ